MEDQAILDLFWTRNPKAPEALSGKYGTDCARVARAILSNQQDAEECVNDALLSAWKSMPPHRPEQLRAFVLKLTRYACLKRLREQSALKRGGGAVTLAYEELSECLSDGHELSERLEEQELASFINAFLGTLPKQERQVFVQRYFFFAPAAQIADSFGFREGKVRTMLFRTRKRLKTYMEKEGVFLEK
ncbi:MAG: RNA polymerase sigma factor [Oscillospiraceae bacterium]|nr:RNA polymerase sigma factor [Oscillospiraceae bacterium]